MSFFNAALIIALLCTAFKSHSQVYEGVIRDSNSNQELANVMVYFANSSVGTISDEHGNFKIKRTKNIQGALVFRLLGYEITTRTDLHDENLGVIYLTEKIDELDTVLVSGDSMSRRDKERFFLDYFIGTTEFSKGVTVTNLDEISLKFIASELVLVAQASTPITIHHPNLGYDIVYDLIEFEMTFKKNYDENQTRSSSIYLPVSVYFEGFPYYNDIIETIDKKEEVIELRQELYQSGLLFFFENITTGALEKNKYKLRHDNKRVKPSDHISFSMDNELTFVTFLEDQYAVKDKSRHKSTIKLFDQELIFDENLNLLNPRDLQLSGFMGELGLGGQLPSDYVKR